MVARLCFWRYVVCYAYLIVLSFFLVSDRSGGGGVINLLAARLMGLRTPCCCCRRSGCIIGFSVVVLGHRGGHHSRARVQCCVFVFVFVIVSRRRSTSMCFCTAPPDTGTKGSGLDLGPQCWYPVASPGCHSAITQL